SPALLTSTSTSRSRPATSCARAAAAPGFDRSAAMTVTAAPRPRSSVATASIGATRRAVSTRSWPCRANSRANSAPRPLEAPVTSAKGRLLLSMMFPLSGATAARSGTEFRSQSLNGRSGGIPIGDIEASDEQALDRGYGSGFRERRHGGDRQRGGAGAAGPGARPRRYRQAGPVGIHLANADARWDAAAARGAAAGRLVDAAGGRDEIDLSGVHRFGKGGAERSARRVQDRQW